MTDTASSSLGTFAAQQEALRAAVEGARAAHPGADTVELFIVNLNGQLHGKRAPVRILDKLIKSGPDAVSFQPSLAGLDIFGGDVAESGIAMEIGDPDGCFLPLPHTLTSAAFAHHTPTLSLQGMLGQEDGAPTRLDPRAVLMRVLREAARMGLTPVVALELEFYLIDPVAASPAKHPMTGVPLNMLQMLDLEVHRAFDPVLADMTEAAAAQGLNTDTVLCEFGAGQFEINLDHQADAARACDDLIALKRIIRGAARRHGLDATFMAKPFGAWSGSGLHAHVSILDRSGHNIFSPPGEGLAPATAHALGGLAATTAPFFLMFAPHLNSYRRHQLGSYSPPAATWGFDNRGAAFRLPVRSGPNTRIEHRIAGADANPYLVMAAILAGMLKGLSEGLKPPPESIGESTTGPAFPGSWSEARAAFEQGEDPAAAFGAEFARVFGAMKRHEDIVLRGRVSDIEHEVYLRRF